METVKRVTGYEGAITSDTSKPDSTPRKLLDVRKLTELGWRASIPLEEGIKGTYQWYLANKPVRFNGTRCEFRFVQG